MLEFLIMGQSTPSHRWCQSKCYILSSMKPSSLRFLSQLIHDLHFKSNGWCFVTTHPWSSLQIQWLVFCHNSPMTFTSNPMVCVLSQLTHDLHFKSNGWCFVTTHPWSSLQIQWLAYLFDLSVKKISKFFLIWVLGKLKRCQEALSTLGLRSRHNIRPPCTPPCNLLMFRFMIISPCALWWVKPIGGRCSKCGLDLAIAWS
jgi:hypothetical protein